eukprot:jgi/Chrzof1/4071/Cz13g19050.t1
MEEDEDPTIASEADVEAFQRCPQNERVLTNALRGVLAEVAITGKVRYKWPLLRPLVVFAMERMLLDLNTNSQVEVGPPAPLLYDENLPQLLERFKSYLWRFQDAPWTIQRLCELVLEPQKQYTKLHKLVLAIDKLLLVTTEVGVNNSTAPLPRLSALVAVNESSTASADATAQHSNSLVGSKRSREGEQPGMGLADAALDIKASATAPAPADAGSDSQPQADQKQSLQQLEQQPGQQQQQPDQQQPDQQQHRDQ